MNGAAPASTGEQVHRLRRRIELQVVVIACAVVGMVTFSLGFLQNVRVSPSLLLVRVPLLTTGAYGVSRRLLSHRYQ